MVRKIDKKLTTSFFARSSGFPCRKEVENGELTLSRETGRISMPCKKWDRWSN
jgi:hypothetical protein